MHLTPQELDKLALHQAGFLAQKRLARGLKLNYPESVALIATQLLELIRDGKSVAELMDIGRRFLGREDVMEGVPEMIHEVQIEGTFPDGSKLVTVHDPIVGEHGDLTLALYGSFLPVPQRGSAGSQSIDDTSLAQSSGATSGTSAVRPRTDTEIGGTAGEITAASGELVLNEGRRSITLDVTNTGDRPIQVGSHYHFIETNSALTFDREKAYGMRLDIPAGTAIRFEPGDTKAVPLVEIAGNRVIRGGSGIASGPVNDANRAKAMEAVKARGFGHTGGGA